MSKSQRQIRETRRKAALRQRLIDMAHGAGLLAVDQGDWWCYNVADLARLMSAVEKSFGNKVDPEIAKVLSKYDYLDKYECLNDLQEFLWDLGVRA